MNAFGDKVGYAEPANQPNEAPQPIPHAMRIMELQKRVGELEEGLKEAAQRIIRLEQRLGD